MQLISGEKDWEHVGLSVQKVVTLNIFCNVACLNIPFATHYNGFFSEPPMPTHNRFFFKQKTAYDIRLSLVGSEMCIRDSHHALLKFSPCRNKTPATRPYGGLVLDTHEKNENVKNMCSLQGSAVTFFRCGGQGSNSLFSSAIT